MSATAPLVDSFSRVHQYLRVSVTDRCNLRCIYCMPEEGAAWKPRAEILSLEEIERLSRLMVSLGIQKIRLTGGEPMVRRDLAGLIETLAGLPGLKTLAMTTNGTLLAKHAHTLRRSGLTALNVSLDTLRPDRFRKITLHDGLGDVLAGIEAALDAGFAPLKLNVVVITGLNDDECSDFLEFVRTREIDVRFIEFMPFPGNQWQPHRVAPWRDVKASIEQNYTLIPVAATDSVARSFRVEGFAGRVSFVSPLTEEFCMSCSRLRLTADGALKSCLFYPAEISLRDAMRHGAPDEELEAMIRAALAQKHLIHPEAHILTTMDSRCMTAIGG